MQQTQDNRGQDNGGRRSGQDRRIFYYSAYLPERRSYNERRCGRDRRIEDMEEDIKHMKRPHLEKRRTFHLERMTDSR